MTAMLVPVMRALSFLSAGIRVVTLATGPITFQMLSEEFGVRHEMCSILQPET